MRGARVSSGKSNGNGKRKALAFTSDSMSGDDEQVTGGSGAAPSFASAVRSLPLGNLTSAPKPKPQFPLSPQQQGVVEWAISGTGNAFVQARAGTGKTYTLVAAAHEMVGSVAYAAFNKKISEEVKYKLRDVSNVRVGTFHSFGNSAWRRVSPHVQVNAEQKDRAMMQAAEVPSTLRSAVRRLVSIAKQSVVGVAWDITDRDFWMSLLDHHSILLAAPSTGNDEALASDLITYAARGLHFAREKGKLLIDFDDMLWLPLIEDIATFQNDWVLVDEAQDTNVARRMMAEKMVKRNGRALWVGDEAQCQPADAMVYVVRKKGNRWHPATIEAVSIANVKVGDRVVSYDTSDSAFVMGRRVQRVASRRYKGHLVRVSMNGFLESSYTPNHKCLASFSNLRNDWAVYVMRKGAQYRVGKCRMNYLGSSGVVARMRHEKADAAWILKTFSNETEAYCFEQSVSGKWGIPQLTFVPTNLTRANIADALADAWAYIGDNTERGESCLLHFWREPQYPLFTRDNAKQQTIKRPIITQACNLLDGCLMLPYYEGSDVHISKSHWVEITVSHEPFSGCVYSLDVEGSHLYVADGIVTHNSIYGFSGADADAVKRIISHFNCQLLPLTVTFRCSKAATALAQRYVPDIVAHENNREGSVEQVTAGDFLHRYIRDKGIQRGDAILCRNTKPLVDLAFRLIRAGIGCHVEGRDIGQQLETLAKRWGVVTTRELLVKLVEYQHHEAERLLARDAGHLIDLLNDRVETLMAISDGIDTVEALCEKIRLLFVDTDARDGANLVTLSTIHRFKGRESDRVFILGWDKYLPSKMARKEWELQQERNLAYVAVTRTRDKLFLVEAID